MRSVAATWITSEMLSKDAQKGTSRQTIPQAPPKYGFDLIENQRNSLLTQQERTYSAHRQSLPKKLMTSTQNKEHENTLRKTDNHRALQKKKNRALQFRLNVAKGFEKSMEPFNPKGIKVTSQQSSPKYSSKEIVRKVSAFFVKQGSRFGSLPRTNHGSKHSQGVDYIVKIFDGNMKQAYCQESQQTMSTQSSPSTPYLGSEFASPRQASQFCKSTKRDSSSSLKPLDLSSAKNSTRTLSSSRSVSQFQDSPRSYVDSFISKAQRNVKNCCSNQVDLRVTVRRNLFKQTLKKPAIQSSLPSITSPQRTTVCNMNHLTRNLKGQHPTHQRTPSKFGLPFNPVEQGNTARELKGISTPSSSPRGKEGKQPVKVILSPSPDIKVTGSVENSPQATNPMSVQDLIDLQRQKQNRIQALLNNFNDQQIQMKDKEVELSMKKLKLQRMRTLDLRIEKPRQKQQQIIKLGKLESMGPASPRLRPMSSFRQAAIKR